MRKQAQFINTKGMNQDLSISKFSPEFIYEGMNIKLNSGDEGTMFTITNERGNIKATGIEILGTAIGYCVLREYLTIFTTTRETTTWKDQKKDIPSGIDRIYRIEKWQHFETNFSLKSVLLFEGSKENSLNFSKDTPIETLGLVEGEKVQKVYWVDNNNQPRLINIIDPNYQEFISTSFDFVPELQLEEEFIVTKQNYGGSFHSGVIQYAFSYWNFNGVESNIIYTTPLYYITQGDRAGSPTEICNNSFKIEGTNLEGDVGNKFDFLRIYSIHRTTIETIPVVRKVMDINIKNKNTFSVIDNGTVGEVFDIGLFNIIGGDNVIINTLSEKDNVLFGGDLKIKSPKILELQERFINNKGADFSFEWAYTTENKFIDGNKKNTTLDKDSATSRGWKVGETYRFGMQLQFANGSWSNPLWLGKDVKNTQTYPVVNDDSVYIEYPRVWLTDSLLDLLEEMGVRYIRPMYIPLSMSNRTVIAQGFLTNTVFNLQERVSGNVYAQPDYITRPNKDTLVLDGNLQAVSNFYPIISTHFTPISGIKKRDKLKIYTNNAHNDTGPSLKENFEYVNYTLPEIHQETTATIIDNNYLLSLDEIDYTNITNISNLLMIETVSKESVLYTSPGKLIGVLEKNVNYYLDIEVKYRVGLDPSGDPMYQHYIRSSYRFKIKSLPFKTSIYIDEVKEEVEGVIIDLQNTDIKGFFNYPFLFVEGKIWRFSESVENNKLNIWSIDKNLINFWSPEIEFGQLSNSLLKNTSLSLQAVAFSEKTETFIRSINTASINKNFYGDSFDNNSFLKTNNNVSIWDSLSNINIKKLETSRIVDLNKRLYYNLGEDVFKLTTPFLINKETDIISYPLKIKTENKDIHSLSVIYRNNVKEILKVNNTNTTNMVYKGNDHIIFSFLDVNKEIPTQNPITLPEINLNGSGFDLKSPYYGLDDNQLNTTWSASPLVMTVKKDNKINSEWDTPYIWIADLVKEIPNQYGGDTLEDLQNSLWVPCGEKTSTKGREGDGGAVADGRRGSLFPTEGDTYFQKYDCLRIQPNLTDEHEIETPYNIYKEMVSVWLETFINLEGRYDDKKDINNVFNVNWNNYNKLNNVYSQLNNFYQRPFINESLLKEDSLFFTFTWTFPKIHNEFIDTWTKLNIANSYTVNGNLGKIHKLILFKNNLLGFQDDGIFEILYNKRVQVNPSDGEPIEISQSNKVEGVRYLFENIGLQNNESLVSTDRFIYFGDNNRKSFYSFDGRNINNLSESLGFKTTTDKILKEDSFKVFKNQIKNDIYFNSKETSLGLSERLVQFESFYDYCKAKYMDNIWDRFIAITTDDIQNNTEIWINHKGNYNSFFGEPRPSWVTYYINPEPYMDKIFDNFVYRADFFEDNILKHKETFSKIIIENEFQNNELDPLLRRGSIFGNKKFRQWAYPFPRQNNSLNRIRNPWVKLQLYFDGSGNRKFQFHDLIISYTI